MENSEVVGMEIDGSLACNKCFDRTFSPYEARLYAAVTKPIERKDTAIRPWMKCEACGRPLGQH